MYSQRKIEEAHDITNLVGPSVEKKLKTVDKPEKIEEVEVNEREDGVEEEVNEEENIEHSFSDIVNFAVNNYENYSWSKKYIKVIEALKFSINNLKEENLQLENYITEISNQDRKEKKDVSIISSNNPDNPFRANQNLTHVTKFYEMEPEKIKNKIFNIWSELHKMYDDNNDPQLAQQIENITSKFGNVFESGEEELIDMEIRNEDLEF